MPTRITAGSSSGNSPPVRGWLWTRHEDADLLADWRSLQRSFSLALRSCKAHWQRELKHPRAKNTSWFGHGGARLHVPMACVIGSTVAPIDGPLIVVSLAQSGAGVIQPLSDGHGFCPTYWRLPSENTCWLSRTIKEPHVPLRDAERWSIDLAWSVRDRL